MSRSIRLLFFALLLPLAAGATSKPAIITVGDSLTFGYAHDSTPYPARLATLTGRPVVNGGIGYDRLSQISSRYTQYFSPFPYGECVLEGGTNDLDLDAASGATVGAAFLAIADAMRTAGCLRVVGVLVPPRWGSSGWTSGEDTERLAANAAIVAGKSSRSWFATVDSDAVLGDGGALPDGGVQQIGLATAYDYGDHLHLNGTGMDALAAAVAAQL